MSKGKALIFSAPSGAGKTTIVKHLMTVFPELDFSISATTRQPREGETHGKDYYFLEKAVFEQHIKEGDFLEWEEVYTGTFYGTLRSEVDRIWKAGKHVVFDVDVEGGVNLKSALGDQALAVFVKVANLEILRSRLKGRGSETEETLDKRVSKAELEMSYEDRFDYALLNDDLDRSKAEAEQKVGAFIS